MVFLAVYEGHIGGFLAAFPGVRQLASSRWRGSSSAWVFGSMGVCGVSPFLLLVGDRLGVWLRIRVSLFVSVLGWASLYGLHWFIWFAPFGLRPSGVPASVLWVLFGLRPLRCFYFSNFWLESLSPNLIYPIIKFSLIKHCSRSKINK